MIQKSNDSKIFERDSNDIQRDPKVIQRLDSIFILIQSDLKTKAIRKLKGFKN